MLTPPFADINTSALRCQPSLNNLLSHVNVSSLLLANTRSVGRRCISLHIALPFFLNGNKRYSISVCGCLCVCLCLRGFSETGLAKGKTSCSQSYIFSLGRMSRCELRVCIFSLLSGFHKECAPIQRLIHAAQRFSIVALHAKFQLVLVPVVSPLSISKGCAYFYLDQAVNFWDRRWAVPFGALFLIYTQTDIFIHGAHAFIQRGLGVRKRIQACKS